MLYRKPTRLTLALSPLLMLSMLSACQTAKNGQGFTNVCPSPEPLSPQILQAMQPNSTVLLKKGDDWLKSTEQLLNSVTVN